MGCLSDTLISEQRPERNELVIRQLSRERMFGAEGAANTPREETGTLRSVLNEEQVAVVL